MLRPSWRDGSAPEKDSESLEGLKNTLPMSTSSSWEAMTLSAQWHQRSMEQDICSKLMFKEKGLSEMRPSSRSRVWKQKKDQAAEKKAEIRIRSCHWLLMSL